MFDTSAGYISFGPRRIHDFAPLPGAVVHGRHRQVEQRRRDQDRPGARPGRDQPLRLAASASARRSPATSRTSAPASSTAAAAVQAERAGLGVDGLSDWRHAAADGRGGRLDRQRRRAGRAARRARDDRRRRPHRGAAAGRAPHHPDRDRRRPDRRSSSRWSSAARPRRRASPATRSPARPAPPRSSIERPLLEGPTTTCRSSASCRRGIRARSILAVIDSPRRGGRTGGAVAAPIFRAVAEATLRHLGVPPNAPDPHGLLAGRDRAGRCRRR